MAEHARELREVIARPHRDNAELRVRARSQETVGDFVDQAVATHRDDPLTAIAGRRPSQIGRVARAFGERYVHHPPLIPERAGDGVLRLQRGAPPSGGVQDDMGMDHAR